MEINKPDLFIEINNSELIFYAIKLKEDFELKIISFNNNNLNSLYDVFFGIISLDWINCSFFILLLCGYKKSSKC